MNAADDRVRTILTPEHVPVRLFPAGPGSRFLALIVDFMLAVAISVLVDMILRLVVPFGLAAGVEIAAAFVIQWGYHVYFEVRRQGRTPGKRLLRLRVVDGRGLPITFQQSFVRNVVRMLDFLPLFYGAGALVCVLDPERRRLGDIAADTLVIEERPKEDLGRQAAEERRFNSLRTPEVLRRLRHRVSLEQREFLLSLCWRAEKMDPKARFDLMEDVGNHYRRLLGIDDPHLSGENIVRGLLAILAAERL